MIRVSRRSGFTLIELLVVIAIIGVLMGLLLPAVQKVREAGARTQCANNMKQLGLALHHHHDLKRTFPPSLDNRFQVHWHWSWMVQILPYLEQGNLYRDADAWAQNKSIPVTFNGTAGYAHWSPWGGWVFGMKDPPQNPVLAVPVITFQCPSESNPTEIKMETAEGTYLTMAVTHYLAVNGTDYKLADGIFTSNRRIRLTDITDGSSNTLLIGERGQSRQEPYFGAWFGGCGQTDYSLPPGDEQRGSADVVLGTRELNAQQTGIPELDQCPMGPYHFGPPGQIRDGDGKVLEPCDQFHFWSRHTAGANFVLADGAVRFLLYNADTVLPAMGTRAGQETFVWP